MKWVFDTKVKPNTEPYRKELFLCNACEYPSKYYGFEGVIQHYAAKHTSALSVGSVVVHWKSEWPEYPPFHPDPTNVSVAPYYAAAPNVSVPYAGAGSSTQQSYGYGGYQPAPVSAPMSGPNPHVYQESPGRTMAIPNLVNSTLPFKMVLTHLLQHTQTNLRRTKHRSIPLRLHRLLSKATTTHLRTIPSNLSVDDISQWPKMFTRPLIRVLCIQPLLPRCQLNNPPILRQ
jgi:hypothetical protein